jgi:glucose-1-phosphate cytidylyltransferase
MKGYSAQGFHDFIICCGYKAHVIKAYFADFHLRNADVTFDFRNNNSVEIHERVAEPWRVTLADTGLHTMTGGRIKRIRPYVGEEPFLLTYGDGVSDVDINASIRFHRSHGKKATLTAIRPEGRFGALEMTDNRIDSFREKDQQDVGWINAGFFVLEPSVFDYIQDDQTVFERQPLERLAKERELMAYKHSGFWQCMDTQRDKQKLERLWDTGAAPWKKW